MKLITHIEPSQLRLGYLCCLALVAGRHLDTRQGLVDRFKKFVFQEVDASDSRWSVFMNAVDPEELENLRSPVDDKRAELNELFRIKDSSVESYQLQALWLAQRELPSHVGLLTEKNTIRLMDMGKSFEILTDGYALSEKGVFLQSYLEKTFTGILDGAPTANPFPINSRPVLRLFMLYLLLSSDIMTPYLIQAFSESKAGDLSNSPKLLPLAAKRLSQGVEDITDISNVEALRGCSEYAKRLQTTAVARNQAQPRYHHLFELGLLDRELRDEKGRRTIPYVATPAGLRAAEILAPLRHSSVEQQETIDRKFFGWASGIYELNAQMCKNDLRKLYYFSKGYPYLEREIGFTPGRMVAVAGCVMALVDGWVIEVDQMFQVLREMAAGPWRKYLEYSGGSRLDQEFLIKVKPEIIPAIEGELRQADLNSDF